MTSASGITTGDRELRGAATQASDLRRIQAPALTQKGSTIALETADLYGGAAGNDLIIGIKGRTGTAGESVGPAEIRRRDTVHSHVSEAPADLEKVVTRLTTK